MADFILKRKDNSEIAYTWNKGKQNLCVLYLHGWTAMRKRKKGFKIAEISEKAQAHYLALDYTGHGESSGALSDFTVGQAIQDTMDVINATVKEMPILIVGNSIGGWIGLWLAEKKENVVGFIGLAPAPDITEFVWDKLMPIEAKEAVLNGQTIGPDERTQGFALTPELFKDGQEHFILNHDIAFTGPVTLIKGDQDNRVDMDRLYRIKDRLISDKVIITLIKGANHHLSEARDLEIIGNSLKQMIKDYNDHAKI